MQTYIALLRGINVGGHRKILMADLKLLLNDLIFKDVKTYIQSGNVVLNSDKDLPTIQKEISEAIRLKFGFDVIVIAKTIVDFKSIFDSCPFQLEEKEKSYFMLLDNAPNKSGLEAIEGISYDNEKFKITDSCIYFFASNRYGRTKFNSNYFEKKLKVNATARNYKTMLKLLSMAAVTQAEL